MIRLEWHQAFTGNDRSQKSASGWYQALQVASPTPSFSNVALSLYSCSVTKISVSEARERLFEIVAMSQSEPVVLELYGRRAAVVVSPKHFDEMWDAFEKSQDILAFDAALADEGDSIPWEQVKIDLGWA